MVIYRIQGGVSMGINERIRQVRKDKNLTMEQFGEKLGLLKTAISKIENGKQNVTDQTIMLICHEFNIDENWLRTGKGEMRQPSSRYIDISTLVNKLMRDENDLFKTKFINMLANLSTDEWKYLERKAIELLDDNDKIEVINSLDEKTKNQVMGVLDSNDSALIDKKVAEYRRQLENEAKLVVGGETPTHAEIDSVDAAESAYIKSRSEYAKKTASSVSNTTDGADKPSAVGE
jgi:transcriptional regulator with XRE-family HTH domain